MFLWNCKRLVHIGLLPSYLERNNSSLVYMVEKLIKLSGHPQSGFYLDEFEKLFSVLKELEKQNRAEDFIDWSYIRFT